MEVLTVNNWVELTHQLGNEFAKRAEHYDQNGTFVFENYELLKKHQYFSLLIPTELGGEGISHTEMCDIIRIIAQYCGSTALAFSMHQHLISAAVWKYKTQGIGAAMLQKVAENQLVLVSTGARDWLGSNGEMTKVEGGYLFSAKKHFASQSIGGDVAVTSAPYCDNEGIWHVLHFSVPMKTKGVTVANDWDVLGMRGTGSQTIIFDKVFVPDAAIVLQRPRDEFHPVWGVVLTVALPLIMAAYLGIAEKAMEIALSIGKKYQRNQNHIAYIIGKLNNGLLSAKTQWKAMLALTNNFDFQPNDTTTIQMLSYKTNIPDLAKDTVCGAMEAG